MKIGRNRMHGWTWTSQGWQRKPRRLRRVKSAPKQTKRKARRNRLTGSALSKPQKSVETQATQIASERSIAGSAPTPAPPAFAGAGSAATPAPRSPRKSWRGKYDDLAKLAKGEP